MTRRLILIRHAKSSWGDFYADDHGRNLNDRGKGAAIALGGWLAEKTCVPDIILTSDAMRTLQTTTLLCQGMGATPAVKDVSTLYLAAPQTIIDICRTATGGSVAVVGHNPGIAMAAELLAKAAPDHPRFADYPTGATTLLDFDAADWCVPGKGHIADFIVPRDL